MGNNSNYVGKEEAVKCATIHNIQRGCQNNNYTVKGEVFKCDKSKMLLSAQ